MQLHCYCWHCTSSRTSRCRRSTACAAVVYMAQAVSVSARLLLCKRFFLHAHLQALHCFSGTVTQESLCICSPEGAGYRAVLTLLSCTRPKAMTVFWPLLLCKRVFLHAWLQALHCLRCCHVPGPGCVCLLVLQSQAAPARQLASLTV